ncbi:MAG: CRISPR-associated helicase Cas3', partial [Dictyoglomaceae bacterium]
MEKMYSSSNLYSHPNKYLEDHLKNVENIAISYLEEVNIEKIPLTKEQLERIITISSLSHDLGKSTKIFQDYLLSEGKKGGKEVRHSLLSSLFTYYLTKKAFKEENISEPLKTFIPISSYLIVKRHHGNFSEILSELSFSEEEADILKKQIESIDKEKFSILTEKLNLYELGLDVNNLQGIVENSIKEIKLDRLKLKKLKHEKNFIFYLINNLSFSILIDADKSEVTVGKPQRTSIEISYIVVDNFKKTLNPEKKPINELREKAYQEALSKKIDLDQRIYFLTLPTGLGKTFTSFAFALKLREEIKNRKGFTPRIIYSLPFLSIIDQNAEVIENVLKKNNIPTDSSILLKHHHLGDVYYKQDEKEFEPDQAKIMTEGWNSEIIITTFVQFFHTLISNQNRFLRKFHRIANSIIILDEVQSIPIKYWDLLKGILKELVEKFNCYIIFSTATQPLIFKKEEGLELVNAEEYFVQLNRTVLRPHISENLTLEEFIEDLNIQKDKSYLFIVNTINEAKQLYNLLREKLNEEIIFLSSHVIPYERLQRIRDIKENRARIAVSTQLVEAGVDIDFDVVYRDISPLDSINQSAGRCNRNWRKDLGEVYIYSLIDGKTEKSHRFTSYIYDKILLNATEKILKNEESIKEIKFLEFIYKYFRELKEKKSQDISRNLMEAIYGLKYGGYGENEEKSIEDFQLIEKEQPQIDVFVEINEEAKDLWRKYMDIKEIKDTFERRLE